MPQTTKSSPAGGRPALSDVLTAAEAAEYLRVAEQDVLELADRGDLPGRKIRTQWRFHRQALSDWLCRPSPKDRLMRHAGAAKDDPYLDQIVEQIYRERGRPVAEDAGWSPENVTSSRHSPPVESCRARPSR